MIFHREPGREAALNRWLTGAIERCCELDRRLAAHRGDLDPGELSALLRPLANHLLDPNWCALAVLDEDGLGFTLGVVDPPEASGVAADELRGLLRTSTLGSLLERAQMTVTTSWAGGSTLIVHALAGGDAVFAIFLASVEDFVPEIAQNLLSLALGRCAAAMRTAHLHRTSAPECGPVVTHPLHTTDRRGASAGRR